MIKEKNNIGKTNNTVEISANREIFPYPAPITIQTQTRTITIPDKIEGNMICQNPDPAGVLFFSAMISIL